MRKLMCFLFGHRPFKSFEFAYLHIDCVRCGEVLEVLADTDELVRAGVLQVQETKKAARREPDG